MDEEEEMDIARARITLKHRNKGKVGRLARVGMLPVAPVLASHPACAYVHCCLCSG